MHPTAVEASVPLGKKVRKGEDRNRKKSKSKSRKVSKSQRENQNSERSPPTLSTNTTPTFSGGSVDVTGKVEKILKGSLDSTLPPTHTVKIQIMGGEVCLRCKGKTF